MSDDPIVWLKPQQIQEIRDACYSDEFAGFAQARNDAIISLMYDAGARPAETCGLTVEMFHADDNSLRMPSSAQKDYPVDASPPPATIGLAEDEFTNDTVRTVRSYLNSRWKDTMFLFPSRKSDAISTRSLREILTKAAEIANVRPHIGFEGRGDPSDVHPHAIRHSVAYRVLHARESEDRGTLYDVRNRLRHRSILTTEKHYDAFERR